MGKRLLLLGAGGHGKVVYEVAHSLCDRDGTPLYTVIDFLDDAVSDAVGKMAELESIGRNYDAIFCGIGNNAFRRELMERTAKMGKEIPALIHPSAYISSSAIVEKGTIVEPKAIVNTNAWVQQGSIISVGAIVDHDAVIGSYSHVNAGAICKAGSHIESGRKLEVGKVVLGYIQKKNGI